jgi:hypothetical protein
MADEKNPAQATAAGQPGQAGQQGQQQIQIPVDVSHRETVYFNFPQVHLTNDEVFVDLASFPGIINPAAPEPIVQTHRLIMNFVTAKRLAQLLGAAVQRHEQMFGVVELDPNRRLRVPPQPPRPPAG